jgi:hypothetical protein
MNKELSANIDLFIEKLGLELTRYGDNYAGTTQCHGGDSHGFGIYLGDDGLYRWKCFTRECEKEWGNDLVGLMKCIKGQIVEIDREDLPLKKKPEVLPKNSVLYWNIKRELEFPRPTSRREDFLLAYFADIISESVGRRVRNSTVAP